MLNNNKNIIDHLHYLHYSFTNFSQLGKTTLTGAAVVTTTTLLLKALNLDKQTFVKYWNSSAEIPRVFLRRW